MIGWLVTALALAFAGLLAGWNRPGSRLSLLLWAAALLCAVIAPAWPVNIALIGVMVGCRLYAVIRGED